MDKLQQLQQIKRSADALSENALRFKICMEEGYASLMDGRREDFSQAATQMANDLFELLECRGFELKQIKPYVQGNPNDDLNDFLNKATAEATAAGQNWE